MILIWAIIVFMAKYLECYLVRAGTITTIEKNTRVAVFLDVIDELLGWAIILLVVDSVSERLLFICASTLGSNVATGCVSERWPEFIWRWLKPKPKKKPKNKYNLTTA